MAKYYRLRDNYAPRTYLGRHYLIRWGEDWKLPCSEEQLAFLQACDGTAAADPARLTPAEQDLRDVLLSAGILEELDAPRPVPEARKYRAYDHRRRLAAIWSVTGRCNLTCIHCLNAGSGFEGLETSLEEAALIIRRLAEYGIESVGFFGGEPLIHKHFWELVDLVAAEGMTLSTIDTNGWLLTEKLLDGLKARSMRPMFGISFDGIGTHDWMRDRPGSEEAALRAIRLAVGAGFPVLASINVNRRTMPRMLESSRMLIGLGVKDLRYIITSPTPRWVQSVQAEGDLTLTPEEFAEFFVSLADALAADIRAGVQIEYNTVLKLNKDTRPEDLLSARKTPPERCSIWCDVGNKGLFVGTKGDVLPCKGMEFIAEMNGFTGPEHNLLHHSLAEIYAEPLYREYLGYTCDRIPANSPECASCEYWSRCYGGACRASSLERAGYRLTGDTLCSRDIMLCTMMRSGGIDRIAEILARA